MLPESEFKQVAFSSWGTLNSGDDLLPVKSGIMYYIDSMHIQARNAAACASSEIGISVYTTDEWNARYGVVLIPSAANVQNMDIKIRKFQHPAWAVTLGSANGLPTEWYMVIHYKEIML